jgi:ElaB/YqjD/DUF883 family membrane-anchored ribosome-binding protein
MHNDASASGASSAETSRAGPAPTESEAEFLARQAAEAQAALGAALGDLGQSLDQSWHQATDVRALIARHPWLALGAAAAVGFAGGMAFSPGARGNMRASGRDRHDFFDGGDQPEQARPSRWSSLVPWEMLIAPITELVRTLVENLFAAFIASRVAAQEAAATAREHTASERYARNADSSPDSASPAVDPI